MPIRLTTLHTRLRDSWTWKEFRMVLFINVLITCLLFFVYVDFRTAGWFEDVLRVFIFTQAIGISIYFFICFSDIWSVRSLWKRSAGLTLLFILAGWTGTLVALGIDYLIFTEHPDHLGKLFVDNTLMALLFGATATSYFVLRSRFEEAITQLAEKEVNEQRLLRLKTKAELEALRAKIDPHFLFNALNSISSLIPVDPPRAEEMVQRLSHLFRYTLDASHHETVRLSEELRSVREYLEIEKVRLGERLSYEIVAENELSNVPLPGLLLQPLVENSVKHGLAHSKNGGRITIHCRRENDMCRIEVNDTGKGFDEVTRQEGFGLSSVRERLALHYGNAHEFQLTHENGVQIVMRLPLSINGASGEAL